MRKPIIISLELLAAAALFTSLLLIGAGNLARTEAAAAMTAPTMHDVEVALGKISITPESLAASGASTQQTTAVIDAMLDELTADPDLISAEEATLFAAKNEADRLRRLVKSGQATAQERQAYQTALQDEATARADRDSVLDTLFNTIKAELDQSDQLSLSAIRDDQRWNTPVEFKVVSRTQAQWVRLRRALANERIADALGEEPDDGEQTYLQNQRADPDVSLASTNLQNNLDDITTTWNQEINGE